MSTVPLRRVAAFYSGGTPSKSQPLYWGGSIPWVSGKDMKSFRLHGSIDTVTEEGAQQVRVAEPGSILVLVRGMMLNRALPLGVLLVPATFNQDIKALVVDEDHDPDFVAYYLASQESRILGLVTRSSHGTGKLETDELASYPIPNIPLPTQRRIAAVLQTWDRAIALAERQLADLRERKRGLMQRLLTGETRLPGFEGAWEEVRLGHVGKILKGSGLTKADMAEEGVPAIRYAELYTTYGSHIDVVKSRASESVADSSLAIQYGDILLPSSGEDRIDIATASVYLSNDRCVVGGDMLVIRPKQDDSVFLGYALNQAAVRKQFYAVAQGVSVIHVYKSNLEEVVLSMPESNEQRAIASKFEEVDSGIRAVVSSIESLQIQKKGLMQRLLEGDVDLDERFDKFTSVPK